jgi:hypothetical protein
MVTISASISRRELLQASKAARGRKNDGNCQQRPLDHPVAETERTCEGGIIVYEQNDGSRVKAHRAIERRQRMILQGPVQPSDDIAQRPDDCGDHDDLRDRPQHEHQFGVDLITLRMDMKIRNRRQRDANCHRDSEVERFYRESRQRNREQQNAAHGGNGNPVQIEYPPAEIVVAIGHSARLSCTAPSPERFNARASDMVSKATTRSRPFVGRGMSSRTAGKTCSMLTQSAPRIYPNL